MFRNLFSGSGRNNAFEQNMASIPNLSCEELELMHRALLIFVRERPVPFGGDYLQELREFERKPIGNGGIYGCKTYGQACKMNEAIVERLSELDEG